MEKKAHHSVMPKTNYYRSDGTGRDTYIAYDNGGCFQPMSKVHSQPKIVIRPKSGVSRSSLRSLHYISDGTGRDSYIRVGDGGLHASASPGYFLNEFKHSLRDYRPLKTVTDPYTWTQSSWKSFKTRCVSREASKKIQDCVNRLYFKK